MKLRRNLLLTALSTTSLIAVLGGSAIGQDTIPSGYMCRTGCDNGNGCSTISRIFTIWHPHQECRYTIGMSEIKCGNGANVPCCDQTTYDGYFGGCTGTINTTSTTYSHLCAAI